MINREPRLPPTPPDYTDSYLLQKRAWMFGMIAKAQGKLYKQPAYRLPEDDLPWWKKVLAEAVGIAFGVAILFVFFLASLWVADIT